MTFESIYELPSQVTASLDEKDSKVWMATYNSLNPQTRQDVDAAKRKAWRACMKLPSSFSFIIKASIDAIDRDREIIDIDSIKKHIDSYIMYGGNLQWEHANYTVGTIWDWEPIKYNGMNGIQVYGNLFGGDIVYENTRKSFINGKNSLSVAGEADRGKYQCDERGCYVRRDVKQLMEISLCAVPANKHCTMTWYNEDAGIAKSSSESSDDGFMFVFNVDEYEIHKDYNHCPILGLKKSLMDIGYDAHATEAGVFIKMDKAEYESTVPYFDMNNLHHIFCDDRVFLNDRDYLLELSFKKGVKEGFISEDGLILNTISKSQFETLYERRVLTDRCGMTYLDLPLGD